MAVAQYNSALIAPTVEMIAEADEALTVGSVLYVFTVTGGQLRMRKASAANNTQMSGMLFLLVGGMSGGAIVQGSKIRIALTALVVGLAGGPPALNDPVFLSDAGAPAITAGTYTRHIGRVVWEDATPLWSFLFDGVSGLVDSGGPANTIPKWDAGGHFAASVLTEDASTQRVKTSKGFELTRGPFVWGSTDVSLAAAANYDVLSDDVALMVTLNGGAGAARTITLPGTPLVDRMLWVKDADGSAAGSNITLVHNGNNIEGAPADYTMNIASSGVVLLFTHSAGWAIFAKV